MLTGRIQSLRPEKGFGFIRPDEEGADVFFHRSALRGDFHALAEGERVTYELDASADRPRATSVVPTTGPRDRPPRDPRPLRAGPKGRERGERERGGRSRETRPRPQNCQRGFVTKLHRDETHGFISADKGGTEIRFEPPAVVGEKRFLDLKIGDYVEFAVSEQTADTKTPEAFYVCEIERHNYFAQTQLSRHPKARRKKPSWR